MSIDPEALIRHPKPIKGERSQLAVSSCIKAPSISTSTMSGILIPNSIFCGAACDCQKGNIM